MLFCYPLFQIMIIVKRCLAIFKYRLIGTISKVKFATTYAAIAHSCHFVRQGGNVLTVDLEQLIRVAQTVEMTAAQLVQLCIFANFEWFLLCFNTGLLRIPLSIHYLNI